MNQTGMMTGEFLDVAAQDLRPNDILGEGRVIYRIEGAWGHWHRMMVGPCVATVEVVELGDGPRCLWRPKWGTVYWEPIPVGTVRVLRGGLPGYFCEAEPGTDRDPCGSDRCPIQRARLDGTTDG